MKGLSQRFSNYEMGFISLKWHEQAFSVKDWLADATPKCQVNCLIQHDLLTKKQGAFSEFLCNNVIPIVTLPKDSLTLIMEYTD